MVPGPAGRDWRRDTLLHGNSTDGFGFTLSDCLRRVDDGAVVRGTEPLPQGHTAALRILAPSARGVDWGCNGDGDASGGGVPVWRRARSAPPISTAPQARKFCPGGTKTPVFNEKTGSNLPEKGSFSRSIALLFASRALVSSPLCCGLLLLCCCCCCTGSCCARASKATAVHSARATRLELSHEHCRHARACSQALRFCSARQRSLPPRSGGLW